MKTRLINLASVAFAATFLLAVSAPSRGQAPPGIDSAKAAGEAMRARAVMPVLTAQDPIHKALSRSELDQLLGPLVLTQPLAAPTVQLLLKEAEFQYRFGNPDEALRGFQTIVSVAPGEAKAWLRIGNLHHLADRIDPAMVAYKRSSECVDSADVQSKQKALVNILLIHLEGAEKALEKLGTQGPELNLDAGSGAVTQLTQAMPDTAQLRAAVRGVRSRTEGRLARKTGLKKQGEL